MRLMILFSIVLACNYTEYTYANKQLYDRLSDEVGESEKIFSYPQALNCIENSPLRETHSNNLFQHMNTFQPSIRSGNTEIEGKYTKHNLQHELKENKRNYRTTESEMSSDYWMHLYRECFNEFPQSEIEGYICAWNSSIELKGIGLMGGECGSVACGRRRSVVVARGCVVGMGKDNEAGTFDLSGSIGVLTNITLKGWRRGGEIISGRLFGGNGYGGEKGGCEKKGGGGGGGGGEGVEGSISVSESHFSSFSVSSAPFLSSPSIPVVSLSHLIFFNISTGNDACPSPTTTSTQATYFMSSCSFSSVCDAYNGGIVPSLNNPLVSLTASNASFVGCCRTRNVECEGTSDNKKHPERQSITENIANSLIWCEWNGSKATGTSDSLSDGVSSGGAICMHNLNSGELSVSHCVFNNCFAYSSGGGIMCRSIKFVCIENSIFNFCIAQNHCGGGFYVVMISTCVRISGCEFQKCKAVYDGGGFCLESFQVLGTDCIPTENGGGESACVFDCSFTLCSVVNANGGGISLYNVPFQFKMRNFQFISCNASSNGGGLSADPRMTTAPKDGHYFYFLFFHECKCLANVPYGHDIIYADYYNVFLNSGNPFNECYTTNTDEKRVCYGYNVSNSGSWAYQHTEKKDWLKDKAIYVSVSGNDMNELCGANESNPCKTVKKAFEMCEVEISLSITLMEGDHQSETTTVEIGTKKISVIGKGRETCSIRTGALSSSGPLFSVSTGHLGLLHMKVDCYSNENPSSPSVVVISDGSGSLSLEDVVITTRNTGDYVMSSSVFVAPLSQLSMVDVEIKDMNISQSLFSESDISSSLLSSSTLFLTATTSEESMLANVTVQDVKLTRGDGVVVAKSVKEGETFVVRNLTVEDCQCINGSGGGIKVELETDTSKLQVDSTTINRCKCSGYGGGMMLYLADGSHDFSIKSVGFSGCTALLRGNYLFVNGSNSARWGITTEKLNVQHDDSKYNELAGYDRSDTTMGLFPLNVYLDGYPDAAHVGKAKDGLGGYDSWFCGFDYYPCATITHAAQVRYADTNKKIELDSGYELAEEVGMTDGNEWEISCATKGMEVGVKAPENFESSCLIEVQSKSSMKNIKFCIPSLLSGVSSLISSNSTLLTLTDCSVAHLSENAVSSSIGYSFAKVERGSLRLVRFEVKETLQFGEHSLIEFVEGVDSAVFSRCNVNNIEKRNGDGGWMNGVIGAERDEGKNGIIVIESCYIKNCKCWRKNGKDGKGGGICVKINGEGGVIVNGTSVIDGCEATSLDGSGGRGGGMMIEMRSTLSTLKIESGVHFSVDATNRAKYGKDVFVCCGLGFLLNTKINATSFAFIKSTDQISNNSQVVLKLCGSENGNEDEVVPLFVYLRSIESKLNVDGRGEISLDHSSCGFEKFGCLTIDYCLSNRANSNVNEIEVASESWIKNEMKVVSFEVSVSGKEEGMRVLVKDEGSLSQNNLIECTKSFEIINLAFIMNKVINGRRNAFIHSSSTVTITSCSFSFENNALTEEKIGYNILNIEGGNLIVDGLVMSKTVTMNGKSPIVIINGAKLDMKNSRVSGVTVEGRSGKGGCIGTEIKKGGSAIVNNCSFSSTCTGGGGTKGGGMMISVECGGSLEIKSVTFTGCQVPTEDSLQKGRGIGGGMFVSLDEMIESFSLGSVIFERCNAWKGKKTFVSGWDLSEIVKKEHLKWEMSPEELESLDELCGWERKTTGEEGYVIPLVVYLWSNWSGDGFVSVEKGGDFSGCGFSEAPCLSIDHLISLRCPTLGEGETHISIVGSGLLSHSISFSFISSSISGSQKVVIEGTKKGTGVTISDEDENELDDGSMISSNVSLSFVNVSFTKPSITTHHEVFIESSGTSSLLSVADCSFGSLTGLTETAGYCLMRVNGGSVVIERSSLSLISELKGFICFSSSAAEVTLQNVNISFASVKEKSLISMIDENQMDGKGNSHSNGNKPVLRVVGCSFANITNEGIGASVVDVGSFDYAVEYILDECTMTSCKSALGTEGGGMKVALKSEETVFKINDSSFSMCKCSSETGCGGGLYIDGYEPSANYGDDTQIPPLNFKIVNILFYMNEAHVGKNIFIRCFSIEHQINETLFALNYNQESLNSNNSICGRDVESEGDVDLIPLITYYYGLQVFVNGTGSDGRRCGAQANPCSSINCGVDHIEQGVMNAILIDGEGAVTKECVIGDLVVNSFKKTQAIVRLNCKIEKSFEKDCIMEFINESAVERCSFQLEDGIEFTHNYLMKVKNGTTKTQECEFSSADVVKLNSSIVSVESGELKIFETSFKDLFSKTFVLFFNKESDVTIDETRISNIRCEGDTVSVGGKAKVEMKEMVAENVTLLSNGCVIGMDDAEKEVSVLNCSLEKCVNSVEKGRMMQIRQSKDVRIEACVFDGEKDEEMINEGNETKEGLCKWNGSLVGVEKSNVEMRETTIMKSKEGGLWVSGGSVKIEKGKFENNNPSIEGYPSARRNAICEGNGELDVVSVKGGDGMLPNTSLWILDEGCKLGGIASERGSSYFIPVLEEVKNSTQPNGEMELVILGKLLLPCGLTLRLNMKEGVFELPYTSTIEEGGYISENEVHSMISSELLKVMENKSEVSVCVVFGKDKMSSSNGIMVMNKSESESKRDDNIDEEEENENEGGTNNEWSLIVIVIMALLLLLLIFIIIIIAIIHRKKLSEMLQKIEEMGYKEGAIINKAERRKEKSGETFEMSSMPSSLLEGMTSQMPLLIDDEEELSESQTTNDDDDSPNENDLLAFGFPSPALGDVSVSGVEQSHFFKVLSAKKPFQEKVKNLKTLHSVIHCVLGGFSLGADAMDVVNEKEVVFEVADLFENLISVGDERVKMMGRQLCPFTIFVEGKGKGKGNEVYVLTEELKGEKLKEEMKRWQAPELRNDYVETEDKGIEQGVVYVLGLILYEMITGEVPLNECKAEKAQEMMKAGVRPMTEGIEGEELVELMEMMWGNEPNDRPTLKEVKKSIKKIMNDQVE
ncbi:uncharacterized protein MONOS_13696 [Monocercomonoides exilis]|uniref:uncharacterized protein n=1 Tax=Monocercomonoides exilis TaxID=2049356 RepID=UPI00355A0753|nr:hypothetical protein MONOS_13696 [Monocercomonoides exilis]|eukprot:MONOS_13696.1-p1 / transcript=MONOS_13696.1 / gene=MONOS_13696 / organism=Monocercomonoides_exilis_PA203 / gene_product=unspecified product / transcript_product=unspecified product / location=Mono_scaffold00866:16168-25122(+) / protein_length=2984 / sequence_SO=supercontig / SO=protein_coding / is_pseudo=false